MKYLAKVVCELIIEAENIHQAREKQVQMEYESMEICPIGTPIPEDLIYSLEPQDEEEE